MKRNDSLNRVTKVKVNFLIAHMIVMFSAVNFLLPFIGITIINIFVLIKTRKSNHLIYWVGGTLSFACCLIIIECFHNHITFHAQFTLSELPMVLGYWLIIWFGYIFFCWSLADDDEQSGRENIWHGYFTLQSELLSFSHRFIKIIFIIFCFDLFTFILASITAPAFSIDIVTTNYLDRAYQSLNILKNGWGLLIFTVLIFFVLWLNFFSVTSKVENRSTSDNLANSIVEASFLNVFFIALHRLLLPYEYFVNDDFFLCIIIPFIYIQILNLDAAGSRGAN